MKLMKRLAGMLLAVCLVVPCTWLSVHAADGVIFFSDLTGISVGETFTIKGSVVNRDGNLGQVEVTMSYDTTAMKYLGNNDSVTDQGNGTLVYSGTVNGQNRLEFDMQFEALVQGETRLEQESAQVTDATGETLNIIDPPGYSDVKIEAGNGTAASSSSSATSSGVKMKVNDTEYTIASSFPANEIPTGFASADITVDGKTVKGVKQENGSAQLLYLLDSKNEGSFFLYNADDGTASPVQIVNLTSGSTIVLLGDRGDVTLPARYQEVDLEISDTQKIPAWQDSKNSRYYLMSALNTNGDRVIYRYDSKDQTYQYYGDDVTTASSGKNSDSGMFGKVTTFVEDHVDVVLIGIGFVFLVLIILILILAVKLHRRNLELDDVYDELDDLTKKGGSDGSGNPEKSEGESEVKIADEETLPKVQMPEEQFDDFEQYDSDDFEDYDASDEEFDDYEEDYDEYEDDYEEEDDEYDSDYDVENFEEQYKEMKPSRKEKSRRKGKTEDQDDDDFSIDFIDL